MADRELWYAQGGPLLYDDELIATDWYPSPYDLLPLRAALISQAYVIDLPVNDIEIARRMDVDGTPNALLKAGADGLPADSAISDNGAIVLVTARDFHVQQSGGTLIARIHNLSDSGRAIFEVRGDNAYFDMRAHGTAYSETLFGMSATNTSMIIGRHGKLLIGTYESEDFVLGTGNAERMRILSSGNFGINDPAPSEILDVNGNINATGVIKVNDVQVISDQVIDARIANTPNTGDADTDDLIDAMRDALLSHGLMAAA